jgi:nitrous oxidase accessory protein NosD
MYEFWWLMSGQAIVNHHASRFLIKGSCAVQFWPCVTSILLLLLRHAPKDLLRREAIPTPIMPQPILRLLLTTLLLSLANANNTIKVKAGTSIQAAIDAAQPGSKITVEPGKYYEQLLITKSGIQLSAKPGAILLLPPTFVENPCSGLAGPGSEAGICIAGDVSFADFVIEHRKVTGVGSYVSDVKVEGFEVDGFGLNIAVVGAKNAEIRKNTVFDGLAYGILTVGSKSTLITRNTIKSADLKFIALCMDDQSDVHVTQNVISDYGIGLCVQTNGADVGHNKVSNTCFGIFVDPGVDGAKVLHNHVGTSNPLCQAFFGGFSGGILIDGATNAEVRHNDVSGISDYGNVNQTAYGIGVVDEPGLVASGNQITHNTVTGNDVDLLVVATGSNEVAHNKCGTSIPEGVCPQ